MSDKPPLTCPYDSEIPERGGFPGPPLSKSQRAADAVTEFCGSWTFIAVFSLLTAGWIALNTFLVFVGHFDPYPFILFNLVLTIVSTFQSPLIMMSQNRQIERDRIIVQGLHAKLDMLAGGRTQMANASDFQEYIRQYFPHAHRVTIQNLAAWGTDRGWDENTADERTSHPKGNDSPNSNTK